MRPRKYPRPIVNQTDNDEIFLTLSEAAVYLRKSKPAIYSLVHRGKIPAFKPFGTLLFKKSELEYCVESSRKGGFYGN
jgi:excisionase family DNA binding protein